MKKPPIAKPVGIPIKDESGIISVVRINEDHVFRDNMMRAWLICKKKAEADNIENWEIGLTFYMALAEIFDKKS